MMKQETKDALAEAYGIAGAWLVTAALLKYASHSLVGYVIPYWPLAAACLGIHGALNLLRGKLARTPRAP